MIKIDCSLEPSDSSCCYHSKRALVSKKPILWWRICASLS